MLLLFSLIFNSRFIKIEGDICCSLHSVLRFTRRSETEVNTDCSRSTVAVWSGVGAEPPSPFELAINESEALDGTEERICRKV